MRGQKHGFALLRLRSNVLTTRATVRMIPPDFGLLAAYIARLGAMETSIRAVDHTQPAQPCSVLRTTVLSLMASLIRGRLAAGIAVRRLAARFVHAGLAAGFTIRRLAARFVRGRPAVCLVLRSPTTGLVFSRLA
jgi:hypothetical protein